MRVALDLDNTLLEWQYHWARLYADWFGVYQSTLELDKWDACLSGTHFNTLHEFYEWYDKAAGWTTQPWVTGAQGFLYNYSKVTGSSFAFVTARPTPDGREAALKTVEPWKGMLQFANNKSKHLVKADFWVDDAPEVLASLAENGKKAIRFARPWNEGCEAFAVAHTWADVWTILEENGL